MPFQQLDPPAVTSRIETFTASTPAPPSAAEPVSVPVQPEALYAPAAGDVTEPLGAAASFWSVKLVVELGLPTVSLEKTSIDPLPLVGAVYVNAFVSKTPLPGAVVVPAVCVMLELPFAKLCVVTEAGPEPASLTVARIEKPRAPIPAAPL